jgi:serine/threonine-protein kinase
MDTATTTKSTLIGRTLASRFRITGFIGEGAMATVYRGHQEQEPRDVAVKVMHPHLASETSFVKRFRREAKAASALKHPNSVQIIDYGIDNELPYIVMELLAGQDLFELLVTEKQLNQALAVRILIQVCDALAAAHDLGIVHRDLKPENVMILRDPEAPGIERVKVLDFGIAKIVDRSDRDAEEPPPSISDSVLTTVGVIVGTPQYMSPEQCRASPIDARSDVYSCGILLYQLLTGRVPFTGDHPFEIAMKQVREPPPPPTSYVPTIHPELEKVILTALEKWPAQRQQSARDLREELVRVLALLPDDRKAGVQWTPPAPGTAFERRSLNPGDPRARSTSEPSTMRSPEAQWPEGVSPVSMDRPKPSIETIGVREEIANTLTSTPLVPDPLPAPRPLKPKVPVVRAGAPAQDNPNKAAAPLVKQGATTRIPRRRKQKSLSWVLLPLAIGVGIGVGVLAYLILHFVMQ